MNMPLPFSFSSRNNRRESEEMYEDFEVLTPMVVGEDGILLPSQDSNSNGFHMNFNSPPPPIMSNDEERARGTTGVEDDNGSFSKPSEATSANEMEMIIQPQPKKKRYHHHTPYQIQEMEAIFKERTHLSDKQINKLGQELGLKPCQVKFWFQNRRTQMKAKQDRNDNLRLKAENETLKNENLQLQTLMQRLICSNCGIMGYNEQLQLDNAQLKIELQRLHCLAATSISNQHIQTVEATEAVAPSLPPSVILLQEQQIDNSGDVIRQAPLMTEDFSHFVGNSLVVEENKPIVLGLAKSSMEELVEMCRAANPLWIRFDGSQKEVLNGEEHARLFQWSLKFQQDRSHEFTVEASRHTAVVAISSFMLVDAFLDVKKWVKLFPSIVSRAKTIQVVTSGILGHPSGSLQLMNAELQFPSPLVPTRKALFLRYCQLNVDEGTWVIVDFPFESLDESCQTSSPLYKRRPSGCIIKDLPDGCSRVTWVEQAEVAAYAPMYHIFHLLFNSGRAFGAQRWLAVLERQSERLTNLVAVDASNLGGIRITDARQKLMNLAERMTKAFFGNMSSSCGQTWTALSDCANDTTRITTRRITEPCQTTGLILAAASTSWLPHSPLLVFDLLRDEHHRALQIDVLSNGTSLQEVVRIATGSHPGNCVSIFRINNDTSTEFILQESSISDAHSVVVFSTLNMDALQLAMNSQDQSCIPLLPVGFIIHPMGAAIENDCSVTSEVNGVPDSNSESSPGQGCLLTVGLQVLVSTSPTAKLEHSDVSTINKLMHDIVHKIYAALSSDGGGDGGAGCANNGGNVSSSTETVARDEPSLPQD